MPTRFVLSLILSAVFSSHVSAQIYTYKYAGLPYMNPNTGEEVQLTGTLVFAAETNQNLSLQDQQGWVRGARPYPFNSFLKSLYDEVPRIVDFSLTDGVDTYRINIPKDEPQVNGKFYGSNISFRFSTDANGDVNQWDISSLGTAGFSFESSGFYRLYNYPSDTRPVVERFRDHSGIRTEFVNGNPTSVYPALTVDQEYSLSELNPWTQETGPKDNLIIVTHGLQLGGTVNGLPDILNAIDSRIQTETLYDPGLDDRTTVIPFLWDESATYRYFSKAKPSTSRAGAKLASQISQIIRERRETDPNYDPNIHFIGHSLGTLVNAEAIGLIHQWIPDLTIEQATMIDTPLSPSNDISDPFDNTISHGKFYYETMPFGSVEQVENYYASDLPRFGQPISGTSPGGSGLQIPDANHTTIHTEFYVDLIASSNDFLPDRPELGQMSWNSPILEDGWFIETPWDPRPYLSNQINRRSVDPIALSPLLGLVELLIDQPLRWLLSTNSPSAVSSDSVELTQSVAAVEFDISTDAQVGDVFLYFNDELLWSLSLENIFADTTFSIPIPYLALETGFFELRIDSSTPIQAAVSDLRIVNIIAVPEPNTFMIIGIGVITLLSNGRLGHKKNMC